MKLSLLILLAQMSIVKVLSQNPQISDSSYVNEFLSSIQKNIGNTYVQFDQKSISGKRYSEKELKGKVTLNSTNNLRTQNPAAGYVKHHHRIISNLERGKP